MNENKRKNEPPVSRGALEMPNDPKLSDGAEKEGES